MSNVRSVVAVGRQVRIALVERGLSQTEAAQAIGMTIDGFSRRITGKVSFRADELIEIARFLGTDPARFLQPLPEPRGQSDPEIETRVARGVA